MGATELPYQLREKLRKPHPLSADSTPLMERRSREETVAIFDELLSQMQDTTQTFYPGNQNQALHSNDDMELGHQNQDAPLTESH